MIRLVIRTSESCRLYVLEERRRRRQSRWIKERAVEDPVTSRRVIDHIAALKRSVVISRVEQVDERTRIVQVIACPMLEEPFEVVYAAVETRRHTTLIRSTIKARDRIAGEHCETYRRVGRASRATA